MIQRETEPGLVAAAVQGNRDAYGQLVRKYQDRLMTTVYHVVQDRADAEDVVQETFLRAFVHLRTFAGRSAFFTWLCRIALNLAIGEHRRRKRLSSLESTRESTGEEPADRGDLPGGGGDLPRPGRLRRRPPLSFRTSRRRMSQR